LIDITFDEATLPFTYAGNSFNSANAYDPTMTIKPDAGSSTGRSISSTRTAHRSGRPAPSPA